MSRVSRSDRSRLRAAPGRLVADLSTHRRALAAAVVLLLGGLVLGYAIHNPAEATTADGTGLYPFEDPSALDIAVNNLAVAVVLAGGALTVGALTVSGLVYNGFVLGTVVRSILASGGSPGTVAVLILTHGVFELTGLVLAAAIGLSGAGNLLAYLFDRRATVATRSEVVRAARLLLVATVLVLVGAVIEIHVTPALA